MKDSPPDTIYYVTIELPEWKRQRYYGSRPNRLYTHKNHVTQFVNANHASDHRVWVGRVVWEELPSD